jgi:hypothetical protein
MATGEEMTLTYEVTWTGINANGEIATFSKFIRANSWAEAESLISPTERVNGQVVATVDFETGLRIDFDNYN